MRNVLIVNAYSVGNRGDAGIVVAMIRLLRRIEPDLSISVMSSYAEANARFYRRYGVESVEAVWPLRVGAGAWGKAKAGLSALLTVLFRPDSPALAPYRRADVVLAAGGGYLYSSRKGPLGFGLVASLFHMWVGSRLARPVLAYPQSVGPFRYASDRWLARRVLRGITRLYSRDTASTRVVEGMELGNATQLPDIALTLDPEPAAAPPADRREAPCTVGITVLDWRFARAGSGEADVEEYLQKVARACDLLRRRRKVRFVVFVQVAVSATDTDYTASRRLVEILGEEVATLERVGELYPEEIIARYSEMDAFVASRMHSAIFAMAGGVPTVALAYQPKTAGTFELLGIGANALDTYDFTPAQLFERLARCLEEGEPFAVGASRRMIEETLTGDLRRLAPGRSVTCSPA